MRISICNNIGGEKMFSEEGFLRCYIVTMRPYLLFLSGITGLLGISLSESSSITGIALYVSAFFFSYGFGQALTDCFQMDTDALSSPYRPLVQGKIQKKDVMIVSTVLLLVCGAILTLANPWNAVLAIAAVIGLASYTFFKRIWWIGPFWNGWITALLCVMGFLCMHQHIRADKIFILSAFTATSFFAYTNFVLIGYLKDVEADRSTKYHTLPVVWGRRAAAFCALPLSCLSALIPAYLFFTRFAFAAFTIYLASLVFLVYAQIQAFRTRNDDEAYKPIAAVLHSYILLLGALIVWQQPSWLFWIITYYFVFVGALFLRPSKGQI